VHATVTPLHLMIKILTLLLTLKYFNLNCITRK